MYGEIYLDGLYSTLKPLKYDADFWSILKKKNNILHNITFYNQFPVELFFFQIYQSSHVKIT